MIHPTPSDSDLFDIQPRVDDFLRAGRITELVAAAGEGPGGYFEGEDWNVLVRGDRADMARLKSQRSLLVDGDVIGDADAPCRIEVMGDAIITGRVSNAQVTAENVRISRGASDCSITAGCDVAIGGNFDGGRIIAGNYDNAKKRIESCRSALERARESAASLERRVGHDERRMDKACRTLRIPLDFNVGRIITHAEGRVSVDLTSFYRSLEERSEAQLETALAEFFAKGVVGVVSRTNRKYLVDFPAREKVFMQLLRSLRELFLLVAERDRTLRSLEAAERELEALSANLTGRQPRVAVAGRVAPLTEIEFILPQIVPLNDGTFDFAHQTASLSVNAGASFGELDVVVRDADGARSVRDIPDLRGVLVHVDDGRVRCDAVASPEVAAALT